MWLVGFTPNDFTSHQATIAHSTWHTTYHMFHATSQTFNTSQTTIFYIWHHITPQSASHHQHVTPPHLKVQHIPHHSPHLTPFRIHNYSTPHPHSTSQYISPHLTSVTTHCIFFHIWRLATITAHCICHILHRSSTRPHFTSHRNFSHLALCNIPYTRTPHSTPRHIPHHTFCISVTFYITRAMSEIATFHITFHIGP